MDTEPFTTRPRLCELNDRDVSIVNNPSPAFVAQVVEQFAESPFTIYATFDDETMFATELTPLGLITMYKHSTLVAASLPNEVVSLPVGGQHGDHNRRVVLPHVAVIRPVREFLLHHRTPEELGWQRSCPERPFWELWLENSRSTRINLNAADLRVLLAGAGNDEPVEVAQSRLHNNTILKRSESYEIVDLLDALEESLVTGHLAGGDIEIPLPDGRVIRGNHDGQFWLDRSLPSG